MGATGAGVYAILVPLLKDSTYTIRHAMDDFVLLASAPSLNVFPLTALKPGDSLTGHLRNNFPCPTTDCRRSAQCWVGDLVSNTVKVR